MCISKPCFWPEGIRFPFSYNSLQTRYYQGKPKKLSSVWLYTKFQLQPVLSHTTQKPAETKGSIPTGKTSFRFQCATERKRVTSQKQKRRLFYPLCTFSVASLSFHTTFTLSAQGKQNKNNKLPIIKSFRQINPKNCLFGNYLLYSTE